MRKEIDKLDKDLLGVYTLTYKETIVYVGAAINIKNRLITHISEDVKKFDGFNYTLCKKEDLYRFEAREISIHNPKYNIRKPPLDTNRTLPSYERRTMTTSFQAKPSENANIKEVAKHLGIGMSEYMRTLILKDIAKQLRKMKG